MITKNSLAIARQKLQAAKVPMLSRVSYYLRVSCAALNSETIRYSDLMKALYAHNPDWMMTCSVMAAGYLLSSDRTINELLSPIKDLHLEDQFPPLPLLSAA